MLRVYIRHRLTHRTDVVCRKKTRYSYGYGEGSKQIEAAQAQVSEGLSSSVFEITTPASIPADNSGHKVNTNSASHHSYKTG